jgi:hypothetical protein
MSKKEIRKNHDCKRLNLTEMQMVRAGKIIPKDPTETIMQPMSL